MAILIQNNPVISVLGRGYHEFELYQEEPRNR